MFIFFILGLVLGGVAVVFALQNIAVVTVTFFSWQFPPSSLAVILILSILAGILITLLILLPGSIGNYFKYKKLQKKNAELTEELRKQKELTLFAKITSPSPETITKIEDGAISHPKSG